MSAAAPGSRTPTSVRPIKPRGHGGRGTDGVLERNAERVQIADGIDHRQHRAGKRAVLPHRRRPGTDLDGDLTKLERAVHRGACGSDRVGDERDAAGGAGPDEAHGLVGEVVAVDNHRDHDIGAGESDAGDAWVTRAERAHGVEDVGDRADAEVERVLGVRGGRVRVAGRDGDAALAEPLDQRVRARQFGRERHLCHVAGVEQAVEEGDVGCAQMLERMRARPFRGEKRAFEMRPENARAGCRCRLRHCLERLDHRRLSRGDERRLVRRDAGEEQRLAGARVVLL